MSLIDKKNLNYLTSVEQFFLSLKNSGLSLSASDYHLIACWEESGVPLRQLCRAIQTSYEASLARNPSPIKKFSLMGLRPMIEEEIGKASP